MPSGEYELNKNRSDDADYAVTHKRPFFCLLVIITITCIILVLSAGSVLVYYRIQYGPGMFKIQQACPGDQVWTECGYACKVSCGQMLAVCEDRCSPGCECPHDKPIWEHNRCITREQCVIDSSNSTIDPDDYGDDDDSVYTPDSDTLTHNSDTEPMTAFVNNIIQLDKYKFGPTELNVNLQGQCAKNSAIDVAPQPIFGGDIFQRLADKGRQYSSLLDLFPYFKRHKKEVDIIDDPEKAKAIDDFIDAIMEGDVMRETEKFLKEQGLVSKMSFRRYLYELWFQPYSSSPKYNITDSSGFEHVFLGETKRHSILGLHNWVYLCMLEHEKGLNYFGYIDALRSKNNNQIIAVNIKYVMDTARKNAGSFFIGTSPAFEMAVYTVCFLTLPNRKCEFGLQGTPVTIQTYSVRHVSDMRIATAYPIVDKK